MELKNKVAIITGASRGIGKSIALSLAKEQIKIVINYNQDESAANQVAESIKGLTDYLIVKADVKNIEEVKSMINQTIEKFGKVDILVNNAGITMDKTFKNMSIEDWNQVINTNLNGTFNCTHLLINKMIEQNEGNIINIASISGQMGFFGQTNYSASKAGIIGFTRALAKEVAAKGIRVNAISPGVTNTEIANKMPEDIQKKFIENIPLRRFANPEEIADAAIFLLKNEYITGEVLNISGGLFMG
jgi:acetoacetyl-CoA reductase